MDTTRDSRYKVYYSIERNPDTTGYSVVFYRGNNEIIDRLSGLRTWDEVERRIKSWVKWYRELVLEANTTLAVINTSTLDSLIARRDRAESIPAKMH